MKLEDIEKIWVEDSHISPTDLGGEALKIPKLHSKWYSILLDEKKRLYALSIKKDELEIILEGYYLKTLTDEELKEYNLPPMPDKRILRTDVSKHINTNERMIRINLQIAQQSDKINFITDVLKQIHGRSFIIKDAIQWAIFQAGG